MCARLFEVNKDNQSTERAIEMLHRRQLLILYSSGIHVVHYYPRGQMKGIQIGWV